LSISSFSSVLALVKLKLPASTDKNRISLAKHIVEHKVDLIQLNKHFLFGETKMAMRYLWLLTHIGQIDSNQLFNVLPQILENWDRINVKNKEASLANYWLTVGVPIENEGVAIELLFNWLRASYTNETTKSRALKLLVKFSKKYPDIEQELKWSLESQKDIKSTSFQKIIKTI
jgi:hypothetical protein